MPVRPRPFQDGAGFQFQSKDHLASLGVGAVWLTPVYVSPMVDNGYDVSDYTGIDPLYGTMEDMEP